MKVNILIRKHKLDRQNGQVVIYHEHVEWTPGGVTMDPHVHLPSTWRDALGKPLTNAAIARYAREGWYGPEVKKDFDRAHNGIVHRCKCGSDTTRFAAYPYLPGEGYWCKRCIGFYRSQREKEQRLRATLKQRILAEYV